MDFFEKISGIQQEIKAGKNQYNSFGRYSYRSAEDILAAVKPLLGKYKMMLTITDSLEMIGDRYYVKATASILDTESQRSFNVSAYAREALSQKGMDEAQITGSASSYARKYALNGLLLLDDVKDADTDEFHKQTQEKGNSEPKKATSTKKTSAPVPMIFKCSDCGNPIKEHQGVSPEQIAKATKKKYGVMICMDCSAKRRAEAEKQEQEELPFKMDEE